MLRVLFIVTFMFLSTLTKANTLLLQSMNSSFDSSSGLIKAGLFELNFKDSYFSYTEPEFSINLTSEKKLQFKDHKSIILEVPSDEILIPGLTYNIENFNLESSSDYIDYDFQKIQVSLSAKNFSSDIIKNKESAILSTILEGGKIACFKLGLNKLIGLNQKCLNDAIIDIDKIKVSDEIANIFKEVLTYIDNIPFGVDFKLPLSGVSLKVIQRLFDLKATLFSLLPLDLEGEILANSPEDEIHIRLDKLEVFYIGFRTLFLEKIKELNLKSLVIEGNTIKILSK